MRRYARIRGPRITPNTPNKNNPPIIPIRIIEEFSSVLFDTIIGLMKLSKDEEIRPNRSTPVAARVFPATTR